VHVKFLSYVHIGGSNMEIKTETDSNYITEHDDKADAGMFVWVCCCILYIYLSVFTVYIACLLLLLYVL